MNHLTYNFSLCIALPLMLFCGFYFLLAKTPDKAIFHNYLRSRRIMGVAILLLAANYSVHFFFEIRFVNAYAAILMNLSTYFLCYWLFSSALTTLLNRFYITRKRCLTHICLWILFFALSTIVLLLLPNGTTQAIGLSALAVWLVSYGIILARRLILAYRRAVKLFDDTQSDNIGAYIKWLSIFTYWAIIFGVGCGLFTFLPDEYIYIWILSSVPFYIYLYCSYINYMLFYEQVEYAFEEETPTEQCLSDKSEQDGQITPQCYAEISKNLSEWIGSKGYTKPGLTIRELSDTLHTNRTYLSAYIKTTYNMSFREWITGLRFEHAKQMLYERPELTVAGISELSGFLSQSYFMKIFKEKEGSSPARWRKTQI